MAALTTIDDIHAAYNSIITSGGPVGDLAALIAGCPDEVLAHATGDGMNPLMMALDIHGLDLRAFESILARCPDEALTQTTAEGWNALMFAANRSGPDHADIIKAVLARSPDEALIQVTPDLGLNALTIALHAPRWNEALVDAIVAILERCPDDVLTQPTDEGEDAVDLALKRKDERIIDGVLSRCPNWRIDEHDIVHVFCACRRSPRLSDILKTVLSRCPEEALGRRAVAIALAIPGAHVDVVLGRCSDEALAKTDAVAVAITYQDDRVIRTILERCAPVGTAFDRLTVCCALQRQGMDPAILDTILARCTDETLLKTDPSGANVLRAALKSKDIITQERLIWEYVKRGIALPPLDEPALRLELEKPLTAHFRRRHAAGLVLHAWLSPYTPYGQRRLALEFQKLSS